MRPNLAAYRRQQVFLNYPYDEVYAPLELALHFAVVAAGMLPVCAKDTTAPDHPRLDALVDAIANYHYSAHDLSRATGEGDQNLDRMNMPIETGMAMFHALATQRSGHRCVFFVGRPHDYTRYASDLAGLDPYCHNNHDITLLSHMYEWLKRVVPAALMIPQPTVRVREKFEEFKAMIGRLDGGGVDGCPTHDEIREVMYQVCQEAGWWDWRATRAGQEEFPSVPLAWRDGN